MFPCFIDRVLWFQELVINEFEGQLPLEVIDRHDVIKHFTQTLVHEPVVRISLNFNQVREVKDFLDPGITTTSTVLTVFY